MIAFVLFPLFGFVFASAASSPWVFEEIKPLSSNSEISKKSIIPVHDVDPTKSTINIKEDIQESILGSSSKESKLKLKEGVKKLLDFLDAGANDIKSSNTTEEDIPSKDYSANITTSVPKFGEPSNDVTVSNSLKYATQKSDNDISNSVQHDSIVTNDLSTMDNTQLSNPGQQNENAAVGATYSNQDILTQTGRPPAIPVRSQIPYATVTNAAAVQRSPQVNPYMGYNRPYQGYQRSGIPGTSPYNAYRPYGYQAVQRAQYQRQQIPNYLYNRKQQVAPNLRGFPSTVAHRYPMYARTRITSPYGPRQPVQQQVKPVASNPATYLRGHISTPYMAPQYRQSWPVAMRPVVPVADRARIPSVQRSHIPMRMPLRLAPRPVTRSSIPYYAQKTGYKFRRMAITRRKLPYNGSTSTRATVGRKTLLPLPLASIMTAARIVVPVQPKVQNQIVLNVEASRSSYSEERGAGAV